MHDTVRSMHVLDRLGDQTAKVVDLLDLVAALETDLAKFTFTVRRPRSLTRRR